MRITSKGQVTIPQAIREKAGLLPHTEVEFEYVRGQVILKPVGRPHGPYPAAAIGALHVVRVICLDQFEARTNVLRALGKIRQGCRSPEANVVTRMPERDRIQDHGHRPPARPPGGGRRVGGHTDGG